MESETETENYKNTSMPPSARLEENKKKEPFSSAATRSLSAVISGTVHRRVCHPRRLPVLRFPGWSEHPQTGASRGSQETEGPAPLRGSPLGAQALGLFWGMAPHTTRAVLSSETRRRVPAGPRTTLRLSHLTPFSLQMSPLPHCHPGSAFCPRHDLKGTEGPPRCAGLLAPCPLWPVPSPPVFVTTLPQGWATRFAGSRTTCHHSCSAPVNQLPMGSPPSARSTCPLPSLTFQSHKGNQHIPSSGLPAAPTAGL